MAINEKMLAKILMMKGDTGIGIKSIKKTGTSGLKDTYTITLTDNSTYTYEVTNGNGIKTFEKTGTSGLVDTYTVTLKDGTIKTVTVTNGKGIKSIAKTSTSGLKDTYTVTLTDGSTTTFTVTNGGSIQSIKKTGGDDTQNIFTVTQADGSTFTFSIPREKGEILSEVDTKITAVNNSIDTKLASGYKKIVWSTITIATSAWSNNTATVSVSGVTSNNAVDVAPAESTYDAYISAGIRASAQGSGKLTFKCKTVPTTSISVNVKVYN